MARPLSRKNPKRQNLYLSERARAGLRILARQADIPISECVERLISQEIKTKRVSAESVENEIEHLRQMES